MSRYNRHAKLLEIITQFEVETQEELAALLNREGFNATQATVSRDIKDLRLIKVPGKTKRQRYEKPVDDSASGARFSELFKRSTVSIDYAVNIVVVKTLAGSANVAGMMIDSLALPSVLGCVAGDDTVFAVLRDEAAAKELTAALYDVLRGGKG